MYILVTGGRLCIYIHKRPPVTSIWCSFFPSGGTTPEVHREARSGEPVQTPEGGSVFRGLQPSEARPPRLHRAKRGRAKVIGRSPLQKNSKRFHQKAQGNHLFMRGWRLHRAKQEAPPRPREGHREVGGRGSPLQKNSKRFHQKAQGNHLF